MASTKTIAAKDMPGRKISEERISVLCCANADGFEKFQLLISGTLWKPRTLKNRSDGKTGLTYYANKKAWMTQILLNIWLLRFDA